MSVTNHGSCALLMPDAYEGTVASARGDDREWSVIEAATYFDLPPLLCRVGSWAVCIDGIYCLTTNYQITAGRFDEFDWDEHMSEKTWVNMADFRAALGSARSFKDAGYISAFEPEEADS